MAGNKEAFQKAMNQGHSAAWDQDWEQAANYYSLALEEFPENPIALSSLGLALFEMQDYESALKCYEKAAVLAPDDPVPHEKIARIYERMGRLEQAVRASMQAAEMHLKVRAADKAIDNWKRVLSLQPDNLNIRTRLATVYERLGRKEEAVAEYISTAAILQHAGDLTRALKIVEYAQQLMPENQDARIALHMLRQNQFLPRPARPKGGTGPVRMAHVRQFDTTDKSETKLADPVSEANQKALVHLASLLFDQAESAGSEPQTGGARRGLSALTRGVSDSSSSDSADRTRIVMHVGQAIDSTTQGDTAQAVVELEHAIQLGLDHPSAYFIIGRILKDQDPERALRYLQQAVKNPDYALGANLLIGQIYQANRQLQEAATAFLQALALADAETVPPEQVDELNQMYDPIIDSQSGSKDEANLERICQTITSQLLRSDWRDYLMKARQQMPPPPEGSPPAPLAEMVLEVRSTQVVEAMAQVRSLAQQNKLRSALEEALFALQFAPTYLPLHLLIAELLLQEQRVNDAVRKFMVVADLYTVRGETGRAIRTLKRVTTLVPMDLTIRQRLIDLLTAQGSFDEALKEYQALGDIYYRLAEFDKARQTYMDALKVAQKSKNARTWGVTLLEKVADIDMQRLNLRQALRIYEQIRTIQPDDPAVRMQLVTLNYRLMQAPAAVKELDEYLNYLEGTGRRSAAIEFISDLLVDHGNRLELRRRLADLYVRDHKIEEAVGQLDAVADALLTEGKHLEAINILETIVSLHPSNEAEYRAAIDTLRRDMLRK